MNKLNLLILMAIFCLPVVMAQDNVLKVDMAKLSLTCPTNYTIQTLNSNTDGKITSVICDKDDIFGGNITLISENLSDEISARIGNDTQLNNDKMNKTGRGHTFVDERGNINQSNKANTTNVNVGRISNLRTTTISGITGTNLNLQGFFMSGTINMNSNSISNVRDIYGQPTLANLRILGSQTAAQNRTNVTIQSSFSTSLGTLHLQSTGGRTVIGGNVTIRETGANVLDIKDDSGTQMLRVDTSSSITWLKKLIPISTNTYSLGDSTHVWSNAWIRDGIFSRDVNATQFFQQGKRVLTETDNATQKLEVINSTIPSLIMRKGSGTGTPYTSASATYVDVDSTNLAYTVTIPTTHKVLLTVHWSGYGAGGSHKEAYAITNGTTILTQADTVMPFITGGAVPMSLQIVHNGTGTSQTYKFRYHNNGAGTTGILNNALERPILTLLVVKRE